MKKNNSSYRPAKFGGPGQDEVHVDEQISFKGNLPSFYTPEGIAPIVLNAVSNNRPFVFDHAEHRKEFQRTYSSIVEACYDDIQAWEDTHGKPNLNPTGPVLEKIN